jgi:hypothetical protein
MFLFSSAYTAVVVSVSQKLHVETVPYNALKASYLDEVLTMLFRAPKRRCFKAKQPLPDLGLRVTYQRQPRPL